MVLVVRSLNCKLVWKLTDDGIGGAFTELQVGVDDYGGFF